MARYTEYLFEFLEHGYTLPENFDTVPAFAGTAFKDIFAAWYKWKEIGFDTEQRFDAELRARALVVVPHYVEKITELNNISSPSSAVFSETLETVDYLAPAGISATTKNESGKTTVKRERTGAQTVGETLEIMRDIEDNRKNIYAELISEFSSLFMGVY